MSNFKFLVFPEARVKKGEKVNIYPIKGYAVQSGYMGYVAGQYILFPTEDEYLNFMEENIRWGI